jgi:hypothetical protein
MDIITYLIALIQNHKEIGIGDLGSLYKKKIPGKYDAATQAFIPPSYSLAFTTTVNETLLLANYICEKRNITTESANYYINLFVAETLKELEETNEVTLNNLGKLILVNQEISFIPFNEVNFGFDFYGLPSVKSEIAAIEIQTLNTTAQEELTPNVNTTEEVIVASEEAKTIEEDIVSELKPLENVNIAKVEKEDLAENSSFTPTIAAQEVPTNEVEDQKQTEPTAVNNEISDLPNQKSNFIFTDNKKEELNANTWDFEEPTEEILANNEPVIISEKLSEIPLESKTENNFNQQFEEEEEEEEEEKKHRNKVPTYVKVLLFMVAIAGIVGFLVFYVINPNIFSTFIKNDLDSDQKIAVPFNVQKQLKPDSTAITDTTKTTDSATRASLKPVEKTEKFTDSLNKTTTFEIIGIATKTTKEADNYIALMKKKGLNAKIITAMPGKLKKISLASYNNLDTAKTALKRLKKELKKSELYIFTNKPK